MDPGGPRPSNPQWIWAPLVHLPPVLATFYLLALYLQNYAWSPDSGEINLLLIAAKVHEYMIIGSLGSVLLHRIRCALLSSGGLPFGFLAAPFQLGSAAYVSSGQLWRAATKSSALYEGDPATRVTVVAVFLLGLAVGPSTSIIMLPKLEWWQVPEPSRNSSTPQATLIEAPAMEAIFTGVLNLSTISPGCRQDMVHSNNSNSGPGTKLELDIGCPFSATKRILANLPQIPSDNYKSNESVYNFVITNYRSISLGCEFDLRTDKETTAVTKLFPRSERATLGSAVAYASSPLEIVSRKLHLPRNEEAINATSLAANFRNNRRPSSPELVGPFNTMTMEFSKWRQPAIAVECARFQWVKGVKAGVAHFTVGPTILSRPSAVVDVEMPRDHTSSASGFSYMPLSRLPTLDRISASFLYSGPDIEVLCLVHAKWVTTDIWVSKPSQNFPQSTIPVDARTAPIEVFADLSNAIILTSEWANEFLNATSVATYSLLPGEEGPEEPQCTPEVAERCLSVQLALTLTDALTRVPYHMQTLHCDRQPNSLDSEDLNCMQSTAGGHEPRNVTVRPSDLPSYTAISLSYYREQHAYGLRGGLTIAAWMVLMLHAILVFVHLTEHACRKRTYSRARQSFSDVGELVELALRTEPPAGHILGARGKGGVDDGFDLWRLRTFVRDVGWESEKRGGEGEGEFEILLREHGERIDSDGRRKWIDAGYIPWSAVSKM